MSLSLAASRPFATSPAQTEMSAGELALLLDRIRAEKVPIPELLQPWLEHPDERVPGAMLCNRRLAKALSAEQRIHLVSRATSSADSRKVPWTPLLDEISYAFVTYGLRGPDIRRSIAILAARLGPLVAWLTLSASRDDVTALMTFRSPLITDKVALGATCLDVALAKPLLASDLYCFRMLWNPSVPQEVLDMILEHAFRRLRSHHGWHRSVYGPLCNLRALSKERATFLSTRMLREIIAWLADLSPQPGASSHRLLEELVVATGEHHARSGSLDGDTIAMLLQHPSEPLRLSALGWLAEMPAPL